MSKLLILRGLPASGKTTLARELVDREGYVRVNKDDIRAMFGKGYSVSFESTVIKIEKDIISSLLQRKYNVVVDDTNLNPKHIEYYQSLEKIIPDLQVEQRFLDVLLEECIQRDSLRAKPVGEEAILKMYKLYLNND